MKLHALIMSGLVLTSPIFADFPEPYQSIHNMPTTPYFVQDGYIFYSLISNNQASVVVDVESEMGELPDILHNKQIIYPHYKKFTQ